MLFFPPMSKWKFRGEIFGMGSGCLIIVTISNLAVLCSRFQIQESCDFHLSVCQKVFEMLKTKELLREK